MNNQCWDTDVVVETPAGFAPCLVSAGRRGLDSCGRLTDRGPQLPGTEDHEKAHLSTVVAVIGQRHAPTAGADCDLPQVSLQMSVRRLWRC